MSHIKHRIHILILYSLMIISLFKMVNIYIDKKEKSLKKSSEVKDLFSPQLNSNNHRNNIKIMNQK